MTRACRQTPTGGPVGVCTGPLLFYSNNFATPAWSEHFYQMLNEVMRSTDDPSRLRAANTFFGLLNKCLATITKVPRTTTLYRGIYVKSTDLPAFHQAHLPIPGNKVVWNTYTSTSLDKRIAKGFAKLNVPGQTSKRECDLTVCQHQRHEWFCGVRDYKLHDRLPTRPLLGPPLGAGGADPTAVLGRSDQLRGWAGLHLHHPAMRRR